MHDESITPISAKDLMIPVLMIRSIYCVNEYNDLLCRRRVNEIEKFGSHDKNSITAYRYHSGRRVALIAVPSGSHLAYYRVIGKVIATYVTLLVISGTKTLFLELVMSVEKASSANALRIGSESPDFEPRQVSGIPTNQASDRIQRRW